MHKRWIIRFTVDGEPHAWTRYAPDEPAARASAGIAISREYPPHIHALKIVSIDLDYPPPILTTTMDHKRNGLQTDDAVYARLDPELWRPIAGGCCCAYCKRRQEQDPHYVPSWDTLVIPRKPGELSFTVHAPDWTNR
jgi:hypothetical protein